MKLALVLPSLKTGGAEGQAVRLAAALAARGHAVQVVALVGEGPGWDWLSAAPGVERVALARAGGTRLVRALRILAAPWRLRRELRRNRPDVVYAWLYLADLVAWLATRGTGLPLAWGLRATRIRHDRRRALLVRACALVSPSVDLTVSNARAVWADHHAAGFCARREEVVPNGVDGEAFHHAAAARTALRCAWGVTPEQRLVGLVGRLDPMKDHATFLRAAALLQRVDARTRFVVVGAGPGAARAPLERLADELGIGAAVRWEGPRADVPAVLSALDVLCSASAWGEGFPNVLVEALACAIPCVATDVGDAREIIEDPERIVPVADAAALAAALARVLADPSASVPVEALRERALARFALARSAAATEQVLVETARPRPAKPRA